jgi:hypothetical protein
MEPRPRQYTEKELKQIIAKAIEIQKRDTGLSTEGNGYTLRDIEEMADGIGIAPSVLRKALSEIESEDGGFGMKFMGTDPNIHATDVVHRELSESELREVMAGLQAIVGKVGAGNAHGSTLSWITIGSEVKERGFATEVSARVKDGQTVMTVRERLGQEIGRASCRERV